MFSLNKYNKRIIILCVSILYFYDLSSQNSDLINRKILSVSFDEKIQKQELKPVLRFPKKIAYYNPLNYLGAGLLFIYQNVFSEQIQASCVYETSCSEYTRQAIERQGILTGTLNGFNQWSECFAGALYEHPAVYRNRHNKIINYTEAAEK